MYKLVFFLLLNTLGYSFAAAQESDSIAQQEEIRYDTSERDPIAFDESYIEELKGQSEFEYLEIATKENWWSQFKKWLGNIWSSIWEALFGDLEAGSFWSFIFQLIPYLILAAIFGFALWLFIRLDPGGSMMKEASQGEVFLTEDEKIIQSQNIGDLIEKAKANGNYKLAVRYYYLLILKKLSENEIVIFQAEKTNEDYVREIKNLPWQQQFKVLTHIYDFIWYGDFGISEFDFSKAEKQFKKMELALQNPENE